MTDFLPTQEPGPGPTDAPLATYQSYSAYTTSIYDFITTITRIAYDPAGNGVAPSILVNTQTVTTTSVGYKVVNLPLLYTGPSPPPPLGTLFTTSGQILRPTPSTKGISNAATTSRPTSVNASNASSNQASSKGNGNAQGSQAITASSPIATARPKPGQNNSNQNAGSSSQGSNDKGQSASGHAGNQSEDQGSTATNGGSNNGQGGGNAVQNTVMESNAPQPTATPYPSISSSIINASQSASEESINASQASVSASNAAESASLASISATNAAQSSLASAASASAASAASSASVLSSSASAATPSSLTFSSPRPTSSTNGNIPLNLVSHGLSRGQIAGIVLGSAFAFLLLLLVLGLLLARRRRQKAAQGGRIGEKGFGRKLSDKWASGFSQRGGSGGDYAAIGAGAGMMTKLAAAGRRGADSINSNEWEEDRLSGGDGSGFFVVGGKRAGGHHSTSEGDSATRVGGRVGLAGLGAGIGSLLGARQFDKSKAVPTSSRQADMLSDEDEIDRGVLSDEDGDLTSERRGLMGFGDAGDLGEMRQEGSSSWMQKASRSSENDYTGWGAAPLFSAIALSAARRGKTRAYEGGGYHSNGNDESTWLANDLTVHRGAVAAPKRNQTPLAERHLADKPFSSDTSNSGSTQSYGDVAPSPGPSRHSRIPSHAGTFGESGHSEELFEERNYFEGAGAAGEAGRGALAAGHRNSGHYPTDSNYDHDERYSNSISQNTPLLGPGAYQLASREQIDSDRLSTIQSVGDFGERGSQAASTSQSGMRGIGSGSGSKQSGYGSIAETSSRNRFASIQSGNRRGGDEDTASVATRGRTAPSLGGLGGWLRSSDTEDDPLDNTRGSIRPLNAEYYERGVENEAAETQSQRASVYNNGSTLLHKDPSPTSSGQSSLPASIPSHANIDQFDGYAGEHTSSASYSSQSISYGNSRSGSRRSEQTIGTDFSRGTPTSGTGSLGNSGTTSSGSRRNESSSGGSGSGSRSGSRSTGAASYNPSYLARQSTSSTRAVGSSSGSSGMASRGGMRLPSSRRRRGESYVDNESSLVVSQTLDSEGRSSRATAGSDEEQPRVSFDPGLEGIQERISPSLTLSDSTSAGSQWRQSPRVESASRRASANLQQQEQQQQQQHQQHQQRSSLYDALTRPAPDTRKGSK